MTYPVRKAIKESNRDLLQPVAASEGLLLQLANDESKFGHLLLQGWGSQSEDRKRDFYNWTTKNSWVEDYAVFLVIRENFNMLPWWEWPQEFKIKNNKFLKSWIKNKSEEILVKKLIQWHLDEQWRDIKNFANSINIKLIGDLPF